jgi:SAM-dependent methyltransferase
MAAPEDPSPFVGAAPYYDLYRAPYAPEAISLVIATFGLDEKSRALDLGCGPGTLAIPLSSAAAEVAAVDPDAGMIAEGRRLAALKNRGNIRWLQSRAEEIPPELGLFRVVTIGQAFHWMDRDLVLRKLARLTEAGGGLALVNPGSRRPQESWEDAAQQVVARFLGPRVRHPGSNPQEPEHEPALRRSECFSEFTVHEFPAAITRDLASIIGCIYSISSSTRPLFGDAAADFEAELSNALLGLNPSGIFEERIETEVTLAPKRPRTWPGTSRP